MPELRTARQLAEDRAAAQGKQVSSCEAAGKNVVRSIDLNTISEGLIVTVPQDYKLYEMPIRESTNTYLVFIDQDGVQVPLGVLTRGARPADQSQSYVRPSGTVVKKCQEYSSFDAFLNDNKGAHWKFETKTPVQAEFNGEARTVNVWQINYVKADGTAAATIEESIG